MEELTDRYVDATVKVQFSYFIITNSTFGTFIVPLHLRDACELYVWSEYFPILRWSWYFSFFSAASAATSTFNRQPSTIFQHSAINHVVRSPVRCRLWNRGISASRDATQQGLLQALQSLWWNPTCPMLRKPIWMSSIPPLRLLP